MNSAYAESPENLAAFVDTDHDMGSGIASRAAQRLNLGTRHMDQARTSFQTGRFR
jgi:hypothetical protein